jgi:hypothetical protein
VKLVHYSAEPVVRPLRVIEQSRGNEADLFKPRGLWVSEDDCEDNWRAWCESEGVRLDALAFAHDVELVPNANMLVLRNTDDIDAFTRRWAVHPIRKITSNLWIDWPGVRERYAGLIITPYIWQRRLSMRAGEPDAMWYYSWDCASGCIWDPAAISSIRLRENAQTMPKPA